MSVGSDTNAFRPRASESIRWQRRHTIVGEAHGTRGDIVANPQHGARARIDPDGRRGVGHADRDDPHLALPERWERHRRTFAHRDLHRDATTTLVDEKG